MKPTLATAILLLALAANGSAAQGFTTFAMQGGPGTTDHTPGLYEHTGAERAKEVQNGTYRASRDSLEGLTGTIAAGLNDLLDAELARNLQQQDPLTTAPEQ